MRLTIDGREIEVAAALPEDVEHLARTASKLSEQDRRELARFAEFLNSRPRLSQNRLRKFLLESTASVRNSIRLISF